MKCEICGKEFKILGHHVVAAHSLSSKEYYDKYFKVDGEGICYCGNICNFISISNGYNKYCCTKCSKNSAEVENKRIKTCLEKYGTSHYMKSKEGTDKLKHIFMDKYGVDNPYEDPEGVIKEFTEIVRNNI